MKVIDRGIIFDANSTAPRGSCSFTHLRRLPSQSILSIFRRGSGKDTADGNCVVARSDDGGATWHVVSEGFERVFDGVEGEVREADVWELGDGSWGATMTWVDRSSGGPLHDAATDTLLPTRVLVTRSTDEGRHWEPTREIETGSLEGVVLTGPGLCLPDHRYLAMVESFQHEEGAPHSLHGAHAIPRSADGLFLAPAQVARHPDDRLFYWDQRHDVCPRTGRPIGFFWSYDRQAEQDVPIHAAWGDASTLTWEAPFSTGIQGQIAAPIPLADGRLLMFYVHRHAPAGMRLIASHDDGRTWDREGEIVVYDHATPQAGMAEASDFDQYWEDMSIWSFGHPAAVRLDEETLLLSHYAGRDAAQLSVHWARVRA